MITPLMHILSCINEKYEMDAPLNILYLGNHDRDLIIKEAKRLSSIFSNENKIYMGESDIGVECVMESQEVAGEIISLSKYTALLLNRIAQCCKVYVNNLDVNTPTVREEDLSEDAVVLRLEVNPFFIYPYVFNVMETPSLTYNAKIAKLQELLNTINNHTVVQESDVISKDIYARLELHSKLSFWKGMLMSDYMRVYGEYPSEFTEDTVNVIRHELANLGFYGFINPLEMYFDFSKSRVTRKVSVDIDTDVVDFLVKVVRSGGSTLV